MKKLFVFVAMMFFVVQLYAAFGLKKLVKDADVKVTVDKEAIKQDINKAVDTQIDKAIGTVNKELEKSNIPVTVEVVKPAPVVETPKPVEVVKPVETPKPTAKPIIKKAVTKKEEVKPVEIVTPIIPVEQPKRNPTALILFAIVSIILIVIAIVLQKFKKK